MPPLEIDNPLWQFSLRVYAAPGVAAECLELQEKFGLDVNVVLFVAWLGAERGRDLDRASLDRIDAAVAGWTDSVVRPLRKVRQRLKVMTEIADPQVQALRKRIAAAELFSEQLEQSLLYGIADDIGRPGSGPREHAARGNIAAVLAARGADAAAFPIPNLHAAIEVGARI